MTEYAMIVDISRCNGCFNCQLACKDEFVGNDYPPCSASQPDTGHFWMHLAVKERGQYPRVKIAYTPMLCVHCDDAPCINASHNNAIYKRDDGIVIIDPEKSRGQRQIVSSCPYGAIYWNDEKNIPQKCTFCAHLLDRGWKEPRCVEACPTLALRFGDVDDIKSEISGIIASGKTEFLHPELATRPRVYYISLPKLFIAGTIIYGDTDECAEGVNITLEERSGQKPISTISNNYGDFEFEGLQTGHYTLTFQRSGYHTQTTEIDLKTDFYLGEIVLKKS